MAAPTMATWPPFATACPDRGAEKSPFEDEGLGGQHLSGGGQLPAAAAEFSVQRSPVRAANGRGGAAAGFRPAPDCSFDERRERGLAFRRARRRL